MFATTPLIAARDCRAIKFHLIVPQHTPILCVDCGEFVISNGCPGADGCDWTTCLDDMTPTGIGHSSVDGFIPQLYDYMEVRDLMRVRMRDEGSTYLS